MSKSMDLFKQDDFRTQYQLAKSIGDQRFGSECKHEQTKGGYCSKCLRKVIDTSSSKRSTPLPLSFTDNLLKRMQIDKYERDLTIQTIRLVPFSRSIKIMIWC